MYTFHGINRLTFYWYTPNEVAFFIGELIFLYIAFSTELIIRKKEYKILPFALAALGSPLSYALARTLSRGCILAIFIALMVAIIACFRAERKSRGNSAHLLFQYLAATAIILVISIFLTSAYQRISLNAASDASIGHRLLIWKSFLPMFGAGSLSGWGPGHSPAVYSNWFQDPDLKLSYISLVSTYLDLGLDYGVLGVFLLVAVTTTVVRLPVQVMYTDEISRFPLSTILRTVYIGGIGIYVVIANIFTSYAGRPLLFLVPLIFYFILFIELYKTIGLRHVFVVLRTSVISAGIFALILYRLALFTENREPVVCHNVDGTRVILRHRDSENGPTRYRIFCDSAELGRTPGKPLRKWFAGTPSNTVLETEVYPFASDDLRRCQSPPDIIIAFGNTCSSVAGEDWKGKVCLILPSSPPPPPPYRSKDVRVLLPGTDEKGLNEDWDKWGQKTNATVEIVKNSGLVVIGKLSRFGL